MNKKELILTVAKDILVAYRVMPVSKDKIKTENTIDALGDMLSMMAKNVEKVYDTLKL